MKSLPTHRVSGLSLIELMIALLIGTILVLGLVQVFGASRAAYQLSEGMARVQENGRFAMDYLQRDIRMAGHFGCVNDQARRQVVGGMKSHLGSGVLDFGYSIRGYDNATPGGVTLNPARLEGTDSIVLRFLRGNGVPVMTIDPTNRVIEVDAGLWPALTEGGVASPTMFGIADCAYADIFVAQAVAPGAGRVTAPPVVDDLALYGTNPGGGPAMLYRAEALVYYIGNGAGGQPSLWRARINSDGTSTSEELVEGIENLQFRYGLDQGAADSLTGYISTQATAAGIGGGVTDWIRVGQVQVGLLAVSPNGAASLKASQVSPRVLDVTPTLPDDGRYRTVYETTIALRNRLYGN